VVLGYRVSFVDGQWEVTIMRGMKEKEKPKFDYWQLKELDDRYARREGFFQGLWNTVVIVVMVWLFTSALYRIQRLEWNAGIEMTPSQSLGIDADPLAEKWKSTYGIKNEFHPTPTPHH